MINELGRLVDHEFRVSFGVNLQAITTQVGSFKILFCRFEFDETDMSKIMDYLHVIVVTKDSSL